MDDQAAHGARPLEFVDLAAHLAAGCKPRSEHRVGAEHEKLLFRIGDLRRPSYEEAGGVRDLLAGFERFGWRGDYEENRHGHPLIGGRRGGASLSLEPGGQFELSGAPLDGLDAIAAETARHLQECGELGPELGLGFAGLGHDPLWRREDVPIMPKGRYDIMRSYMPKVGGLGLDMMLRTCTVQANLDFASEADMAAKFRVSLALQPVATALFANSPFVEGRPSGWLSTRARVWTDTDADRTGLLGFVFEEGFGFETYANWALDVPMYFVKRGGRYVDLSGRSFRAFMAGELPELPGERPTQGDWADHLTTLFPEVRLKTYLEMRGADMGSARHLDALPALWTGLLYDPAALAAAWDVAKGWTREDREALRLDAARVGLKAQVAGRPLAEVAREVVAIAGQGLAARGAAGAEQLDVLAESAETGRTQADRWLELYDGEWGGDVRPIYAASALT
jgi:glutamate--cysteine ligase